MAMAIDCYQQRVHLMILVDCRALDPAPILNYCIGERSTLTVCKVRVYVHVFVYMYSC